MKKLYPLLLLCNAACATITTGQNQSLSVVTDPPKAKCTLSNDKGTWYVNETPGSVTVNRAYGDITVICTNKDDDDNELTGSTTVKSNVKGMDFGNILFGGIIGAAVDAGTGAGYDYPSSITVPLHKKEEEESANDSKATN